MREFFKKYKNEIISISIVCLIIMYLIHLVYYTYHRRFVFVGIRIPTIWEMYFEYIQIYIPPLLAIIAWVCITRKQKLLYGYLTLILFLDLYVTYYYKYYDYFWNNYQSDLVGHIIMLAVIILAPFVYRIGKKKKWVYVGLSIVVFLVSVNREIVEFINILKWYIQEYHTISKWLVPVCRTLWYNHLWMVKAVVFVSILILNAFLSKKEELEVKKTKGGNIFALICFASFYFIIIAYHIDMDFDFPRVMLIRFITDITVLKRMLLVSMNYIIPIFCFITALLLLKGQKFLFYVCNVVCLTILILCIHWEAPLVRRIFYLEFVDYFYSFVYIGSFLFMIFYPAVYDLLRRFSKGKKTLIFLTSIVMFSMDIVQIAGIVSYGFKGANYVLIVSIILVKAGLFFTLCKSMLSSESLQADELKLFRSGKFILKVVVPIILVASLLFCNIQITKNGIIIPRKAEIDGYWFIGSVDNFVEAYENPYLEKRNYLEFKYIGEEVNIDKNEGYEWGEVQDGYRIVKTYERKLEAVCHLDEFTKEEARSSQLHEQELSRHFIKRYGQETRYRFVLSDEIYDNTVFYYQVEYSDIYIPDGSYEVYVGRTTERNLTYDILVQGKEIPAYYLNMVEEYGVVKVTPILYYRGENPWVLKKDNPIRIYSTIRQY